MMKIEANTVKSSDDWLAPSKHSTVTVTIVKLLLIMGATPGMLKATAVKVTQE